MPFVYAAKFVCGTFGSEQTPPAQEGPVEPGNYATAINIHNPNPNTVSFGKKAVLLYSVAEKDIGPETPRPPSLPVVPAELPPDWGMEIDGPDIRDVLLHQGPPAPNFIKGWVVIESPDFPLDVVAVYTVQALEAAEVSIAIDRVTATQV